MLTPTTAFWWIGRPNFGDTLTPLILERFANLSVKWAPFHKAKIVGVGSVLDAVPPGWSGIVAGAGKLFGPTQPDLSRAEVYGLRGPLTARTIKGSHPGVLGDPGLLADELVVVEERDVLLGLVPHWSDQVLELRPEFLKYAPLIIRVKDDPLDVIRAIGRCNKIVTSSLHGAIVADAFGIPRMIVLADGVHREGGDFKFRDYCASLGMEFKVGVTQEAPRFKVQDLQHELYDMLETVGARIRDEA